MAHDKNVLIDADGNVCEMVATVFKTKDVTFYPSDSKRTITITFLNGKNPFNWPNNTMTAPRKGAPITATVQSGSESEYEYTADSEPKVKSAEPKRSLGVPRLIVDGGGLSR